MKNKYYLDTQTDSKWANDGMAMASDTLKLYGCLASALSNTKLLSGTPYSPKMLNDALKSNKGYAGLRFTNVVGNESFIMWNADKAIPDSKGICEILNCTVDTDCKDSIDTVKESINTKECYYIARVLMVYKNAKGEIKSNGHYINILYILEDKYICFDTYDGKVNILEESDITKKIKVKFND